MTDERLIERLELMGRGDPACLEAAGRLTRDLHGRDATPGSLQHYTYVHSRQKAENLARI